MASWERKRKRQNLGVKLGIGCLVIVLFCGGFAFCTGQRILGNIGTLAARAVPDTEIVLVRVLNSSTGEAALAITGPSLQATPTEIKQVIDAVQAKAGTVVGITPAGLPSAKPRPGWVSEVEVSGRFTARGRKGNADFSATLVGREGQPWRVTKLGL